MLELVLDQTRRFCEKSVDAAEIDRAARIPVEVLDKAGTLGLFSLTIPEAYGGLGLSLREACRVVAEIARHDRSLATTIGLHAGLGTRGLVEMGSEELRARWLPRLATGEWVAAFCATEPQAGSDLTALSTVATPSGDELVLDGEKAYVTNGGFAGLFTVLARTPGLGGARGTSLICVPRETEGVEIGPEEHKLGIRGSSTVTVRFDGVRIPLSHVLGTPGGGLGHAYRVLQWGRTLMSAGCVGTARAAMDATLAHVAQRRQFGKPIGEFPAARSHVAWMASRLFAMEQLVDHVGQLEEREEGISVTSAVAKVIASEGAFEICDRAIQLHGAMGFVEDTGVARMLRDCRVTRIFEGANDVLLVHAGTALAGAPEATVRRVHDGTAGPLSKTAERWEEADRRLREALDGARRRHGVTLVRQQLVLRRMARAHAGLLAASVILDAAARGSAARDLVLSESAVNHLLHGAELALDALPRAAADAARDLALTDLLYGPEPPSLELVPAPQATERAS